MSKGVVILGAGGQAKVVIDILQSCGIQPVGCLSSAPAPSSVLQVPVLGDDSLLVRLLSDGITSVFVALGDNCKRRQLIAKIRKLGFQLINAISPRATISQSAKLGEGIAIMPGAIVNADSVIGDGAIVNTGAIVDHDCVVGAFAHIAPGAAVCGFVHLGEGVLLGAGAQVIPEITIGAWATVGAGGVVIRSLPENVVAVGTPAVVVKLKGGTGG